MVTAGSTVPSTAAEPEVAVTPPVRRFRVGTLSYTRSQLINVFFWMLWGDLCLNVMESAIPRLVPLQLKALGGSNALVGLLTGSLFSLLNWVMNPIISTWSDRYRSRLGRRIPFMLYPTPFLAACLILVGFSTNIAGYLQAVHPGVGRAIASAAAWALPDVSTLAGTAQLTIALMAVLLVLYKFFDLFPQCVYYYLFADIIPQETMGTFVSLFRVMGTAGGFIFHYWLLGYSETNPKAVYLGCGLLYFVAFMALCLVVREGDYPPPPPRVKQPLRALVGWARQSFTNRFYWKYFFAAACFRWAFAPFNMFLILYAQKALGLQAGEFGHVMALVMAIQLPLLFVLGPVIDRFHPIRIGLIGLTAMTLAGLAGFTFIHGRTSFVVLTIATFVSISIFSTSLATLGPRLLPRQRYGQFCAATMMVVETGMLVFAWACGTLLDHTGERFVYLWLASFSALGLVANVILYRAWKQHGGDEHYVAPGDLDTVVMENVTPATHA